MKLLPSCQRNNASARWMGIGVCLFSAWVLLAASRNDDFQAGPIVDPQRKQWFIRGQDVKNLGGTRVELIQMRLEQDKELIVEAPRCIYDLGGKVAHSDGPISLRSADGRLSLKGVGFRWQDTALFISNQVEALVYDNPTNAPIRVTSGQFQYRNDVASFFRNVLADGTEIGLSSEFLSVQQRQGADWRRIDARTNVALVDKLGGAKGFGAAAVSLKEGERELLELSGGAAWQDAERSGTADTFLFNQAAKHLRATGNAKVKVRRDALGRMSFPGSRTGNEKAEGTPGATNQLVELSGDLLNFYLPLGTNSPFRGLTAERNVTIFDPAGQSEARAGSMAYTNTTGIVRLEQEPVWLLEGKTIKGDVLELWTTNEVFQALGRAFVRLPASDLVKTNAAAAGQDPREMAAAAANDHIDIESARFKYENGVFEFREDVRGKYFKGEEEFARLRCAVLTANYSNVIESMHAEGRVLLEQQYTLTNGVRISREVECESFDLGMSPNGALESASAYQRVVAAQTEIGASLTNRTRTTITADEAHAQFASNLITHFKASRNVRAEQEIWNIAVEPPVMEKRRAASGSEAVFSGETQRLELTGRPTAVLPEGEITEADKLIWDAERGTVIIQGRYRSIWKRPPGQGGGLTNSGTNRPAASP